MNTFPLPRVITKLVQVQKELITHYNGVLRKSHSNVNLAFTLDGNLVGDLGEAIAADLFGIRLVDAKSIEGIDGFAPDGRTVQVKATGSGRGPAFRQTPTRADHLLFFELDFQNARVTVVFNGPEHYAVKKLPKSFSGQRSLTAKQIRAADKQVMPKERLSLINASLKHPHSKFD